MTTKHMVLGTILAAMGWPALAGAQTTTPPPAQTPTPPVVAIRPEIRTAPMVIDLSSLQDEIRLKSLEDAKFALQGKLLDQTSLGDLSLMTQDALSKARWAVEDAAFSFQNQDAVYRYAYSKGDGDYSSGKDLLNQKKYTEAIIRFDRVIAQKGANADGAQFWKAYCQFRLGKADDSVATIAMLRKDHPQSLYMVDAKVLEADAKRLSGRPVDPAAMDDDDLKLLAINGMKSAEPDRAIAALEGVLTATNSLRVKKQALYTLALINQPRAHQILVNYAKGAGNPDLQLEAIRYLAAGSNKQVTSAELMEIYKSTQDTDVKLAVITALRTSGNMDPLRSMLSESNGVTLIRSSALNGLSGSIAPAELWSLYEKETNKDLKLQMVSIFGSMQAVDQLNRIIKTDKDADVQRRAIRALGQIKSEKTGAMLVEAYSSDPNVDTRKSVISALANQNNAEGLVAIARKEASLELKKEIVRKLSEMAPRSKVAADYLMEIIK